MKKINIHSIVVVSRCLTTTYIFNLQQKEEQITINKKQFCRKPTNICDKLFEKYGEMARNSIAIVVQVRLVEYSALSMIPNVNVILKRFV